VRQAGEASVRAPESAGDPPFAGPEAILRSVMGCNDRFRDCQCYSDGCLSVALPLVTCAWEHRPACTAPTWPTHCQNSTIPGSVVVCPMPDPNNVTVIHLTRSLETGYSASSPEKVDPASATSIVWLIILDNGTRCYRVSGANASSSGMSDNYDCLGGDALYNDPQRTSPIWTIFEQRLGTADMTLASIAKAYS